MGSIKLKFFKNKNNGQITFSFPKKKIPKSISPDAKYLRIKKWEFE